MLNWLMWFSCPVTHHTGVKWAFQRLILQHVSKSEKVEEKYMILKPKDSKSLKLHYCCPRNLNCATAGVILCMTCPQVCYASLR